ARVHRGKPGAAARADRRRRAAGARGRRPRCAGDGRRGEGVRAGRRRTGRARREPLRLRDDEHGAVARAERGRRMSSAALAALISVVGLSSGTAPGTLVWTGTPARLGPEQFVVGATSPILSPNGRLVAYVVRGQLRVQPVDGGA